MRPFILVLTAVIGLAINSSSFAAERLLQATGSSITFVYKQMNVPLDGRFRKFSGKINFDAAKPEAASIDLSVDVASFNSNEDADPEVVKPTWLDATGHPQARFTSKTVKALGGGHFQATGTLSIKGISRDVVVPFDFKEQGATAVVDGQFTLKRGDYKIGEGEWSAFDIVANDVQVKFHLVVSSAVAAQH